MNNHDLMERNETNKDSRGGTELLQERLYDGKISRELLEQFQIVPSRVRDLDSSKFRIFWAHDLPGDPESEFLKNEGWRKFHKIVFVSNWQMQAYIATYNIPWSHCTVIENSIEPISASTEFVEKDKIHICYTPTPHRGLNILFAAFDALSKKHDNVVLDVFSSFELYGWKQRDEQYADLFEAIDNHPNIVNHGTKSNEEIRKYLSETGDIFAYPSTWPETSCLCLIEAMSAGLMCIHSNYGALADTSSGFTYMYQFSEDQNEHASRLYQYLDGAVQYYNDQDTYNQRQFGKIYADKRFNWNNNHMKWIALLSEIIRRNPDKKVPGEYFVYNV